MFQNRIHDVGSHEWESWVREHDAVVVDVREPDEWRLGVLPGATKIRLAELESNLSRLDQERAVLVVCRSGNRSGVAARFLDSCGFGTVGNLAGGMRALGRAS